MQQLTHTNNGFNTRPLYLQVRDKLAEKISCGEWKPEMQTPNEHDLAVKFGVSSGTMRKALDLLEREGFLARRQGRGTIILNKQLVDAQRLQACREKAAAVMTSAVSEVSESGDRTRKAMLDSIERCFAEALFDAGYSGETGKQ